MFKKGQFKEVKWMRPTKEWYLSKGYIFTKIGDSFTVKAEDLSRGSKQEIVVVCDYCGKEFKKPFVRILNNMMINMVIVVLIAKALNKKEYFWINMGSKIRLW